MLDVRVSEGTDPEALVAFVERLAGSGRGGPATGAARSRIVDEVHDGRVPAGIRTLAGALESPVPPRQRRGDEDEETLLGAVSEEPLVVLSEAGPAELARALADLTGYGMRVLLTGAQAERLGAVRAALPADVAGRVVDRLPALPSTELRRLRRLLATAGVDRYGRAGQQLPPEDALPGPADVAGCCDRANRVVDGTDTGASGEARIVPGLLRDLEIDRRAAVTQVARCALASLETLTGAPDADRLQGVAGRLVHSGLRAEFESLQGLAARQRDDRARLASGARVEVVEPLPEGGDVTIRRYLDFLDSGGRSRSYFKPQEQKEAEPLLRGFRLDGAAPQTYDQIATVSQHLHLARRDDEIARLCSVLGLPVPRSPQDLPGLVDALDKIAAAARSVGALRHDVLFLQQDSPVSVPDLAAAERVARAIVDYDEHGDPAEAADELERLALRCEAAVPFDATAPEHTAVVAALRRHDAEAYAAALEELGRARREMLDRDELQRLLGELSASHPDLARAWAADGAAEVPGFGLLHVAGSDDLLRNLPSADSADLVVVLGAGALQADGLLLTAAAPRMLAVVGDEPRAESSGTTLLEVLNQASARFLRGTGTPAGESSGTGAEVPVADVPVPAVPPESSVPDRAGVADIVSAPAVPAPRTGPPAAGGESRPSAPSAMAPARRGTERS
ncbi:superfamily I DNA and RNA helicase [Pseudonocardia sp. Ae168_Ps1]|uniref:hypothetical protein n=1 Tax=unclassified Pseudonocardia TaxID=2619320 RepID=UPI0006CB4D53|nr:MULTISPECIES: hypothetical protein [unclassified Pseudonocardia]ALE75582.1 hypothetical protein FRP1_26720 [Pseudonocardia sp. EC080625-04]ALL74958.1 hypothetical protein AD006_05905 [Pseudonocardia sp. EC080610-09]ALL81980.1 hypothetical protein AD017_13725 [Pseudonocardia sp. EC080619-01]OLL74958.1 superfamily I DNA and RNA helicase [Pseudonocardia sp. Ae150A_Ps1]OLL80949.1 superfamily I DNA and RNA helicase [Pseudonocardia sp. Ae168_Ps1]